MILLVVGLTAPAASAAAPSNWTAYLHGPRHASSNPAATAITPANAGSLVRVLHWQDPP